MPKRESGYYPPGAEFDPLAPWNEVDKPEWSRAYRSSYCEVCNESELPVDDDYICKECFESIQEKSQQDEREDDRDDAN